MAKHDMTIKLSTSFTMYDADAEFNPYIEGATSTAELIEYGLREGAPLAEYRLARRLHEMREALFKITRDRMAKGENLLDNELELLDVEATYMETKRICT